MTRSKDVWRLPKLTAKAFEQLEALTKHHHRVWVPIAGLMTPAEARRLQKRGLLELDDAPQPGGKLQCVARIMRLGRDAVKGAKVEA